MIGHTFFWSNIMLTNNFSSWEMCLLIRHVWRFILIPETAWGRHIADTNRDDTFGKNDDWWIYRPAQRRPGPRLSCIVLQYAHYVATNGFIALEWTRPSACQAAIPGDRPFELCARARLRVCIQSPHEIYVCPACLPHTNISMNFDVRSPVCQPSCICADFH